MRRGKVEGLKEGFSWKIHKLANLIQEDENVFFFPPSITRETYLPGNSVLHSYTGAFNAMDATDITGVLKMYW